MKTKEIKKTKLRKGTLRKYDKPVSLYPLKPEEALAAFMKVDPENVKKKERKLQKKRQKQKSIALSSA